MIDTNQLQNQINALVEKAVWDSVRSALSNIDLGSLVKQVVEEQLSITISKYQFPEKSISSSSIFYNTKISGDDISGGVIENFSSTGIEDFANTCVLSLDDNEVKITVPLSTKFHETDTLVVNGDAVFKGNFNIDNQTFENLSNNIQLKLSGEILNAIPLAVKNFVSSENFSVDSKSIKHMGDSLILENSLNNKITHSNIQKLGYLQELQVKGESLFANTLLVTNKRIGINTPSPDYTFELWDQECQISWNKKKQNHSYFGSNRSDQEITLGSNGHDNLTILPDGSVKLSRLYFDNCLWTSSQNEPSFESSKGHTVFNSDPSNGIFAWVCMGGARWSSVKCG